MAIATHPLILEALEELEGIIERIVMAEEPDEALHAGCLSLKATLHKLAGYYAAEAPPP